ncbi:MAG TPA: glycosyltransferase [Gaiellaceae bacterium]|nr:glycosyltransferase [Gaiellaceae bacterium]
MTDNGLRILVVSTQFPFPPRWGFAMRVHQLVSRLTPHHEVTLLSYSTPDDRPNVAKLQKELDVVVVERPFEAQAAKRRAQSLTLLSPRPYSCRATYLPDMQAAIDDVCAQRFDVIQLESSLLCTFRFPTGSCLVLDEHNIEYEVFRRMQAGERSLPRRAYHVIEHARFRRFEQRWWRRVSACVLTSDREERIVREHAPATLTAVVPNGVDLDYFSPSSLGPDPNTLVFNGLMKYRPNLDAAHYLVDEIWPLIRRRRPEASLTIVGRGEPADLERLRKPGVTVTGEVADIRPYVERAAVVAVPVRMGGGTRLKVVEGLAMGKAMVSTSLGCEGVNVADHEHLLVADGAERFAASVVALFDDKATAAALGRAGRALMEREYSWDAAADRLEALYRQLVPAAVARPRTAAARTPVLTESAEGSRG